MVLDFEYGINTGNRFLDFVDHDEDPDEFIANQTQPEEKPKKSSTKDTKTVTKTTKKPAATTTTTSATTKQTTTTASASTTKANKENVTGKSTNTDQRRQQTNDFNQQQPRGDSARGSGRGFPRRGGQDRPQFEGGFSRGGGGQQQRTQRFNKFEGQETSGENWTNETTGNDSNQSFGGYRGRGGGRGRGYFDGGRGGGRGRGRGGRGNFNNRNFDENTQETTGGASGSSWQQNAESNFDNTRSQSAKTTEGQELDTDVPTQERPFEPGSQRGGRGHFRSRTFHNNRNYGSGRQNQPEHEDSGNQDEYRRIRRQYDRQPRNNVPVKPFEKKDGEGAHNWGKPTENPDEIPITDELIETTGDQTSAPVTKDWSQQVDEAEKQMTLDEYKKQLELKKRATQEKLPQFTPRAANEGVDPKSFKQFAQEYRKKNEGEESNEEIEEGSDEEHESGDENDDEQISGKKKIITIPLHFKPINIPRGGPMGSRGGPRRGSGRFRPNRDEQTRSKSPNQQQSSYQKSGEYQTDEQQPRPYRGGSRGTGRGEYRRPGRGSRGGGGYNRSNIDSNTPDFDNTVDFPTLPKQ